MFAAEVLYTAQDETTKQFAADEERRAAWHDWADAAYAACDLAYILHTPGCGTEVSWSVVDTATLPPAWREALEVS
jgi:hypothetical protein